MSRCTGGAPVPGPGGTRGKAARPPPGPGCFGQRPKLQAVLRAHVRPSRPGRCGSPFGRPGPRAGRAAPAPSGHRRRYCAVWLGLSARGPCASLRRALPPVGPAAACPARRRPSLRPGRLPGLSAACAWPALRGSAARPAGVGGPWPFSGLGLARPLAAPGPPWPAPACGPGSSPFRARPGLVAPRGRCGPLGRFSRPRPRGLGLGSRRLRAALSWSDVAIIPPRKLQAPPAAHGYSPLERPRGGPRRAADGPPGLVVHATRAWGKAPGPLAYPRIAY